MTIDYNNLADKYKKFLELPVFHYVDEHTFFSILGDLTGKSILDLGCGEGIYTRKLKQRGARRVVGVDISEEMIELARQEEVREPLGIEYIVGNMFELGEIGSFDLVVACYVISAFPTKEQLLKTCQTISKNLKPTGRFVAVNVNLEMPPNLYHLCEKYGFNVSIFEPLQEGTTISSTFLIDGEKYSVEDYYLSRLTYEWTFQTVGFKEIHWHGPMVSPEGVREFGKKFWQDFLDHQISVYIECVK